MNVFILEDDVNCKPIIQWIEESFKVKYYRNIEDAAYYLEYEDGIAECDKYIFDASVPAACVVHKDETEEAFNGALNGIDFLISCFERLGLDNTGKNVAVLSAFDATVKNYNIPEGIKNNVKVISKNSNDLIQELHDFLYDK